jgi:hypothetical protein
MKALTGITALSLAFGASVAGAQAHPSIFLTKQEALEIRAAQG